MVLRNRRVTQRLASLCMSRCPVVVCLILAVMIGIAGLGLTVQYSYAGTSDTTYGDLKWSWKLNNSGIMGLSSPATDGEYFYVMSSTNASGGYAATLYKIDRDGNEVARLPFADGRKAFNTIAPAIAGDRILVPLDGVEPNGEYKGHGPQIAVVDRASLTEIKRITYADYTDYPDYQAYKRDPSDPDAAKPNGFQTNVKIAWDGSENAAYVGSWKQTSKNSPVTIHGTYVRISLDDYTVTKLVDSEKGFYWSGAAIGERYVVFGSTSDTTGATSGSGDAVLYAYDKNSGTKSPIVLEKELKSSGSVCTDTVWDGTYYYIAAKGGYVYRSQINNDVIKVKILSKKPAAFTCTPCVKDGRVYIGGMTKNGRGTVCVFDAGNGALLENYTAPADVKKLLVSDGKIFVTYNARPGGIYEAVSGRDYFVPEKSMQQYCISTILQDEDGILYYVNDSYNFMAAEPIIVPPLKKTTVAVKKASSTKVKVSWKKIDEASGYLVSQSAKKSKTSVVKRTAAASVKIKAKKKETLYYKVRPYRTIAGQTIYGPWSGTKKFVLK